MRTAYLIMLALLLPAGVLANEYYQADPARLAQLQAERCARLEREATLINKRLSRPVNYPADVKKMKAKLQTITASRAQYCATDASAPLATASTP